ncbi:RNA polymerase sigma-70 factor (family 1) [Pedobacter africanus]|uniref:RNA polymerase sigma-70 factor (ECF subfamily) n=1 Tax=Pedobacter africanus TaxID=151894 RepID=A0ACC6L3R2_9SPHI|nr:RNA polymerase sigma-70 factor [Pedobacter africanus]MDR6786065.1 RNA polymerase sigma-70 factor (ECF subfamily) [Pedobacter africanus]
MDNYSVYTDQQLTETLRKGDQRAFAEIYNRYHALLFIHADSRLKNHDESGDIIQDVFAHLWEKREELNIDNLVGYLYKSVRNRIFNLIKHKKVITGYLEWFSLPDINQQEFADHLIREKQFSAMITAEIEALPPRERQVFELRRFENLSNKEVASRLDISEATAADYMKKAVKTLKPRIGLILFFAFNHFNSL